MVVPVLALIFALSRGPSLEVSQHTNTNQALELEQVCTTGPSPTPKCKQPAKPGGKCEKKWHCATCKKNADDKSDCIACISGYHLVGIDRTDCTGLCVSGPALGFGGEKTKVLWAGENCDTDLRVARIYTPSQRYVSLIGVLSASP
jgi:hypothetical protein